MFVRRKGLSRESGIIRGFLDVCWRKTRVEVVMKRMTRCAPFLAMVTEKRLVEE